MFAIGALSQRQGNWTHYLDVGHKITMTCAEAYKKSKTGLAGEVTNGKTLEAEYWSAEYHLRYSLSAFLRGIGVFLLMLTHFRMRRPELIESVFYMWRLSHDQMWRDIGWDIVQV